MSSFTCSSSASFQILKSIGILGAIEGGDSETERKRSAVETSKRPVSGTRNETLHTFSKTDLKEKRSRPPPAAAPMARNLHSTLSKFLSTIEQIIISEQITWPPNCGFY